MNVSKSPLRRATALVAGSLIGMAGAVAFASPALAHHSVVSGSSTCDQVTGEWVVDWTVTAIGVRVDQPFQWTQVSLTPANTTIDNADIAVTGKNLSSGRPITGKQRVPGSESSASLTVRAKWDNRVEDKQPITGTVELRGECGKTPPPPTDEESPSPSPSVSASSASPSPSVSASSASPSPSASSSSPSTSPSPSTSSTPPAGIPEEVPAEPIFSQTCDTITIGVDNTNNDSKFTIDYKTSKGEERTLVVEPGKQGSETFSATDGFTVDVTFTVEYKGKTYTESATIPFEQGDDCEPGSGGGDGELPLTGAAAGGIAGGAAALLAIGGGLFFMARRRKVKFTA